MSASAIARSAVSQIDVGDGAVLALGDRSVCARRTPFFHAIVWPSQVRFVVDL
jgi:hypothetical protein